MFKQKSIAARIRSALIFATVIAIVSVSMLPAFATDISVGCVEADGTPGLRDATGDCITAAEYDELFSFEALNATEVHGPSTVSVAVAAGLVDDGVKASERRRVFMGVDQGSFAEVVVRLVGGQVAT